jgi:hypothetical protein
MDFLFFDAADRPLFARNDAESASWTVQDMQLQALFPYCADKPIQRGQRIGFTDETGVFQPFEIRKAKTYEPDHYQEITAEHICVAELTDEHAAAAELTDVTAQAALSGLLSGTLWSVGNVTATGTSSADLSMGSVWQNVRTIEQNWNVYITPRVTFDASGITGRYLDIAPAGGAWHGLRLSIDKNADDMGVTWDDTTLVTAMYGYGGTVDSEPLTFASVTWIATDDHPAKPADQTYIEDPAATAAYGRNGRPRFGFYQNGDIKSASVLLEKTWQALKQAREPTVTIDCSVRDLYRMGYADQPIRLHDTVIVDVSPIGVSLQREITALTVDLLDPTETRPTIGKYIPNIVYIERENARRSGGGGGRGGGGGYGQSEAEYKLAEFYTQITANEYAINLEAVQRAYKDGELTADVARNAAAILIAADNITSLVVGNGASLDSDGHIVVDANGVPVFTAGSNNNLYSQISQNATEITQKVSKNGVISSINQSAESITIQANKINLQGYVTVTDLSGSGAATLNRVYATTVSGGSVAATGSLSAGGQLSLPSGADFIYHGNTLDEFDVYLTGVATGKFMGRAALNLNHSHEVTVGSDGTVTLGAASTTGGSFNIADTRVYRDGVAAAAVLSALSVPNDTSTGHPISYSSADKTISFYPKYKTGGMSAEAWWSQITINDPGLYNAGHAAGVTDGEAGVTVSTVARESGNTFSSNKKTVYFDVTATASNGATKTSQVAANVTTAYDAGADSVQPSSVAHVSHTYNSAGRTYSITVKVTCDNGNSKNMSFTMAI